MDSMRSFTQGLAAALLMAVGGAAKAAPALAGDYVETRTCNVYTGACHANGEAVTAGREAILAWHITRGGADGVSLAGLNAVAVVEGSDNLASPDCQRTSVVYVDLRATGAQRKALAEAL